MSYRLTETDRKYISIIDELSLKIKQIMDPSGINVTDLALNYSDNDYTESNPKLTVSLPKYSLRYSVTTNNLYIEGFGSDTEGNGYSIRTDIQTPGWIYDIIGEFNVSNSDYIDNINIKVRNDVTNQFPVVDIPLNKFWEIDVKNKFTMYGYEVQNPDVIISNENAANSNYVLKLKKPIAGNPILVWEEEFKMYKVWFISPSPSQSMHPLFDNKFKTKTLVERYDLVDEPYPEPISESYNFAGWYLNDAANKFDFANTKVTETLNIYAKWNIKTYVAKFNTGLGRPVQDQIIEHFGVITLPYNTIDERYVDPNTQRKYEFKGWYLDPTFNNSFDNTIAPNRNITIYANWPEIPTFRVSFNWNGGLLPGGITPPEFQQIERGLTATNPGNGEKDGWTWKGWYSDAACTTLFDFTTAIIGDITLYAGFEEIPDEKQFYWGNYLPDDSYIDPNYYDFTAFDIDNFRELFNGNIQNGIQDTVGGLQHINGSILNISSKLETGDIEDLIIPAGMNGYVFVISSRQINMIKDALGPQPFVSELFNIDNVPYYLWHINPAITAPNSVDTIWTIEYK